MDKITASQLAEFCKSNELEKLEGWKQFEHFSAYVTLRRHHARTFNTDDIVIGEGGDTGIDSIAIIVNGALVTEPDMVPELLERNGYLEAHLIFVQAEQSEHFSSDKIGKFGFAVQDFFREEPTLVRNQKVTERALVWKTILEHGNALRTKPACRMYYVTTGSWQDDQNLSAHRDGQKAALEGTQLFSSVEFLCYGGAELHRLYNQTKMAVERNFVFKEKTEIPGVTGVKQSYLGYIPASEFVKVISDDSGDDILGSIFDENVRDWQDYNDVNKQIRKTIESGRGARFVLMNNGVTIITRELTNLGSNFTIKDFQIVNGCQTSHVVFDQRNSDIHDVSIPVRLIHTEDDDVKRDIIQATNTQTQLKPEQIYAMTDFSKDLEMFFPTPPDNAHKLYYERRDCQYDQFPEIEKTRIVSPQTLIRAFGAMFLDEPTRVTRDYKAIRDLVGYRIFKEGDRLEPYYAAAFGYYRLEFLLRNRHLDPEFKAARYHILMAFRHLINAEKLPRMNSGDMKERADEITSVLWDAEGAHARLTEAAKMVREVVGEPFDRDHIRTEPTKEQLLGRFAKSNG